jgi:hypothetical protein
MVPKEWDEMKLRGRFGAVGTRPGEREGAGTRGGGGRRRRDDGGDGLRGPERESELWINARF